MLNLTNVTQIRRYCGLPLDIKDGVVIACSGEPIGSIEFLDEDGDPVELEICQMHAERYNLKDTGPFSLGLDTTD